MPNGSGELLLRVWWRKTALEEDVATIRELEFLTEGGEPDLSPSVYAIAPSEVVQVVTEHFAGSGLQNVKNEKQGHFDLASITTVPFDQPPGRTGSCARARRIASSSSPMKRSSSG